MPSEVTLSTAISSGLYLPYRRNKWRFKVFEGAIQAEAARQPSDLSEEDMKYLEQNFGNSVTNAKKNLDERLKKLSKTQKQKS